MDKSLGNIGITAAKIMAVAAAALLMFAAMSCRNPKTFTAKIDFEGLATQNLEIFYDGDNAIVHESKAAMDGQLELTGESSEPTVVEIYSRTGTFLGRFVACNGSKIEITFPAAGSGRFTVKGNKTSEALAAFLDQTAGADSIALNVAVSRHVADNPSDPLSPILLAYYFNTAADPQEALRLADILRQAENADRSTDALLASLAGYRADQKRKFKPVAMVNSADTTLILDPADAPLTLIYIARSSRMSDTLGAGIAVGRLPQMRLAVIRTTMDTVNWRRVRDSYKRPNTEFYWSPGGMATSSGDDLQIPSLPYCLLVDSLGNEIFRGASADDALDVAESFFARQ